MALNFMVYVFGLDIAYYSKALGIDKSNFVVYVEYCWASYSGRHNT